MKGPLYRVPHFIMIHYQTWPPQAILVSDWPIFKKSANQKQEFPAAAMFVNGSGENVHSLERTFHRCFLPSFSSFG